MACSPPYTLHKQLLLVQLNTKYLAMASSKHGQPSFDIASWSYFFLRLCFHNHNFLFLWLSSIGVFFMIFPLNMSFQNAQAIFKGFFAVFAIWPVFGYRVYCDWTFKKNKDEFQQACIPKYNFVPQLLRYLYIRNCLISQQKISMTSCIQTTKFLNI